MSDLDIARKELSEKKLALCIVRNSEVLFSTASHGISGFMKALDILGERLEGASVADRVVGKAIALLCVYSRIQVLWAGTLSRQAKTTLEKGGVGVESDKIVQSIFGSNMKEICPFEKLVMEISNPEEAYRKLRALSCSIISRNP